MGKLLDMQLNLWQNLYVIKMLIWLLDLNPGFIVGTPLAYELGVGFVPARKKGKLPGEVIKAEYDLEYGTDIIEMHKDAIKPGQKVVVVDDLLATGGTILSTVELVEKLGGIVSGIIFLIELTELNGRQNLSNYDVYSLIKY